MIELSFLLRFREIFHQAAYLFRTFAARPSPLQNPNGLEKLKFLYICPYPFVRILCACSGYRHIAGSQDNEQ